MTREVEITRVHGEVTWRWRAVWFPPEGGSEIGLGFTKRGALRNLRSQIAKSERRRNDITKRIKVSW